MKIVSVIGVRPQFIKLFSVSRALRKKHHEVIIHTGQHYDFKMSELFLRELQIPQPNYNLQIGSGSHAEQTGKILIGIEKILLKERPDAVIVFGDTNSTLGGALAASKLLIPIVHVEAGVRSYNREMPEEINRILTDRIANLLFCPTESAVNNLRLEGITRDVHWVGDVMYDAALFFGAKTDAQTKFLTKMQVQGGKYLLATIHRPSNTDKSATLYELLRAFAALNEPIIFPAHPRTRKVLQTCMDHVSANVRIIDPLSYSEMLLLIKHARMILTDSGGLQKEAFFFSVPCVTLRTETEWTELVNAGWNRVVGTSFEQIVKTVEEWNPQCERPNLFGDGNAGENIVNILENSLKEIS